VPKTRLNWTAVPADNHDMDLMLQFCAMALTSTMILRLAIKERARVAAELVRVRVEPADRSRRD
jgi:hypothetical protein